jgi:hypothetical protein
MIYGELESEKLAQESNVARQIVDEINKFGVNDRQRFLVMYFLSLELENIDEMKELAAAIKTIKPDLFLSSVVKD